MNADIFLKILLKYGKQSNWSFYDTKELFLDVLDYKIVYSENTYSTSNNMFQYWIEGSDKKSKVFILKDNLFYTRIVSEDPDFFLEEIFKFDCRIKPYLCIYQSNLFKALYD